MDIGLALTYVTRDSAWVKKVLIGGIMVLIPIIGWFIVFGYAVRIVRNVINGVADPLPEWDDFGGDLVRGFMAFIGALVWSIPVIIVSACGSILQSSSDSAQVLGFLVSFCLGLPLNIIWGVFVTPTIIGRFAVSENLGDMFQVSEVIAQIQRAGIGAYLLYFVLYIIAGFISVLGLIACFIGVIFTIAYGYYAMSHGMGQLYRRGVGAVTAPAEHPAF